MARAPSAMAALLATVALVGCTVSAGDDEPAGGAARAVDDGLAPGMRVAVTVADQPDLSGTYTLDRDGAITMPLLGEVDAYGRAPAALEEHLVARLADGYLREPQVTVEALRPRPFFVLGDVRRPGSYTFRPGMTVAQAIRAAGGRLEPATPLEIVVTPAGNESDARRAGLDDTLRPGDVVALEEARG